MKWEQHGEIKENKKEKCEMQQHVSLSAACFSGGARAAHSLKFYNLKSCSDLKIYRSKPSRKFRVALAQGFEFSALCSFFLSRTHFIQGLNRPFYLFPTPARSFFKGT
jgi:hypothetical protein